MTNYKTLREIDVTKHMEKKGKFTYLSWSWAVDTLLLNDESATWEYKDPLYLTDGTVMVFCTVTAFDKSITMQLPVLNHTNKPIQNPNAFDFNTAMQRCLVKAIACHGIGLHIYAGEDLPPSDLPEEKFVFTIEHRIFERDFLYGLAKQNTIKEVQLYCEAWKEKMDGQPAPVKGTCGDQARSTNQRIKDGKPQPKAIFKYVNTQEAKDFLSMAERNIETTEKPADLALWKEEVEHRILALDKELSAKIYEVDSMSPGLRILKLYEDKIEELKGEK